MIYSIHGGNLPITWIQGSLVFYSVSLGVLLLLEGGGERTLGKRLEMLFDIKFLGQGLFQRNLVPMTFGRRRKSPGNEVVVWMVVLLPFVYQLDPCI